MKPTAPDHCLIGLPASFLVTVIVICILPSILNLLGIDFGTPGTPLDARALSTMSPRALMDAVVHSQEGIYVHTILEWSAFCVAFFTIILAFLHYSIKAEITTVIIGLALFFAGAMDALHILAADHLIGDVSNYPNFVALSGAIRRFFTALIIVLGALIFVVRSSSRRKPGPVLLVLAGLGLSALAYGIIWLCGNIKQLPQAIFPSAFITRPYDMAALMVFVVGGLLVMPRFYRKAPTFLSQALAISFIPQIVTQLHMVLGSSTLYDNHYNISHFLKIIAYLVPFAGLSLDYLRTYRQLDDEISERQQAEKSLENSLSLLGATIESTADGLLAVNTAGKVVSVNQKFAEMWGIPAAVLTTMDPEQRLNAFVCQLADPKEFLAKVEELYHLPEAESFDVIHFKDGRIFDRYSLPQRLGDKIIGRVWSFRDVTARCRAEEALRHEEERLMASIFSSIQDGLCIVDSEFTITRVNPIMEQWYAHNMPLVGQKCYTALAQRTEVCEACPCRRTLQTGSAANAEVARLGPAGKAGWLDVYSFPLLDQGTGRAKGAIQFLRDVTERKQAEKQLKKYATELERANEDVKQFAYIVSHDLRAPLVNLKGFAAELRSALEVLEGPMTSALPQLSEEQRQKATEALRQDIPEALDFIDSSATRMDNFVSAILKLSRIGRRELKYESVNPTEIVESVLKGLAHQIAAREVKVTVGPLPEVIVDRTALEQIMGNILSNAVNYLEPSRAGEIEVTGEKDESETRFFIRDNGRGIAKEDMDKVFAPFRRAGKQDIKGEGMGMAYVQTMVRRHGGSIRCESELDVGTTFIVTLSNHPEPRGEYVKPDGV